MYKLRELKRKDIESINLWRNDPDLIACLGAPYRYINEDVDQRWYENYMNERSSSVRCAIVDDKDEGEILGLISLLCIDNINRSAVLHIMIGNQKNRGKGIGTYAVRTMVMHAFNNLNLHRIELDVLENNKAAIRLYEKTGFVKEGIRRKSTYKNGKYVNMIVMGLLKEELLYEINQD